MSIIGDQPKKMINATAVPIFMPVVQLSDLKDAENPINDSHLSAKKMGSVVVTEMGEVHVALGSDRTSPWQGAFSAAVTPA